MKEVEGWLFPDKDGHWIEGIRHYQNGVFEIAASQLQRTASAIDVGAHVGIFSVRMARIFSRVVAIEPDIENYRCLVRNTSRLRNPVLPIWGAAGEDSGQFCKVVSHCEENSGARSTVYGNGTVPVFAIDDFGIAPGMIKIDVEGNELAVLVGAATTLRMWNPVLIVENATPDIWAFVERFGYQHIATVSRDSVFAVPAY